jgi:hypothetical protein
MCELENKEMKRVTGLPDRHFNKKKLLARYGISYETLKVWLKILGILDPAKGGYFSDKEVNRIDEFWIGTKIERLRHFEYEAQIVLKGSNLDKFLQNKYSGKPLAQYLLELPDELSNHPVVVATIKRLQPDMELDCDYIKISCA